MALLMLLTMSALAMVYSKHQSRELYNQWVGLSLQRDALHVQWDQLRLEHSYVASHGKIEKAAQNRLHMQYPRDVEILVRR